MMNGQSAVILLGFLIIMTFLLFFILFIIQFTKKKHRYEMEIQNIRIEKQKEQLVNVVAAMEAERSRIGRDIHDDIAPLLTALQLSIKGVALKYDLPNPDFNAQSDILQSIYTSIRVMSRSLYPLSLKQFGLSKALEDLVHIIRQSTSIHFNMDLKSLSQNMDFEKELTLYRIIQEFCNNSLKHSLCSRIDILTQRDSNLSVISLSDDGIGFDQNSIQEGLGLKNMKMRAEIAGFDFKFISKREQGTKIILTFSNC